MRYFYFFLLLLVSYSHAQTVVSLNDTKMKEEENDFFPKNSYLLNDSLPFQQYQKVEIGIELPPEIAILVGRYVYGGGLQGINPYLEWELAVRVVFTHLETNVSDTIDAFYYQQFSRFTNYEGDNFPMPRNKLGYTDAEYQALGGWNEVPLAYQFMARFVPFKAGMWQFEAYVERAEKIEKYPVQSFYVVANNNNPFIEVSPQGRYLYKNNAVFQPIGCNISWPETKKEFDSVFAQKNLIYSNGEKKFLPENYRSVTVSPRVYEKYNEQILKMNKYGANWFRIIMSPESSDIEFEELGNYTKRLHQAYELDELLALAEQNDFYIQWCMLAHFTFKNKVYGITHWDWDDEEGANVYAYRKAFNLENPIDFFKSEEARGYYKQRIRYILARWGYSAHIGLFEVMSEISNVGSEEFENSSFYDDNYPVFVAWQEDIAAYIKKNYFGKIHLLTSSYSGMKHAEDKSYFTQDNFDVMGTNIYQFAYFTGAPFFTKTIGKSVLNQAKNAHPLNYTIDCSGTNCAFIFKPFLLAESEPPFFFEQLGGSPIEVNRHIWQSLFSGIAFNLPWYLWYETSNYTIFSRQKEFMDKFPLESDEWHPGFMKIEPYENKYKWLYNEEYVKWVGKDNAKIDLIYLRKNSLDEALGVLTNRTVNYQTEEGNFVADYTHPFGEKEVLNLQKEKVRITGLKDQMYQVMYYLPDELDYPIYVQQVKAKNGQLKLNYNNMQPSKERYIVLFKVIPLVD